MTSRTVQNAKPRDTEKSGCCGGKSNASETEKDRAPPPRPKPARPTGGGCCCGSDR